MKISEKSFQSVVVEIARWHGWKVFHPLPAQNSRGRWATHQIGDPGFPDLVLAHSEHGLLFAELKSLTGRLSEAQIGWINTLTAANCAVVVWRPSDLETIKQVLGGQHEL
jgi:hypothetical protein